MWGGDSVLFARYTGGGGGDSVLVNKKSGGDSVGGGGGGGGDFVLHSIYLLSINIFCLFFFAEKQTAQSTVQ